MLPRLRAFHAAACLAAVGCSLEGLAGGGRPVDPVVPDASTSADGGLDLEAGTRCPGCEVIVQNEDRPTELVRHGDRLFWIRAVPAGRVVASDLDGRGVTTEADHVVSTPRDLVASAEAAFALSEDGRLFRFLGRSTCEDAMGIRRLAAFGEELLFAKEVTLARGNCGTNTNIVSESVTAVVGDPPYAWYARAGGDIVRCDASAGQCSATRSVLATGQGDVTILAQDDTRVYWVATNGGRVEVRARRKGAIGAPDAPELLGTAMLPKTLLPAGDELYWTDLEQGVVVRASTLGATPPVTIARGLDGPWGLAATNDHVYVTESRAGRIVRMPRR